MKTNSGSLLANVLQVDKLWNVALCVYLLGFVARPLIFGFVDALEYIGGLLFGRASYSHLCHGRHFLKP
jgi:hypothetical protein